MNAARATGNETPAAPGVRRRLRALAAAGMALAGPAQAIVVDRAAQGLTIVLVFVAFSTIVFLVVLALVAAVSRAPLRAAQMRRATIAFPAATTVAALALLALHASLDFARFERAVLAAAIGLAVVALVLVGRAVAASRRR